MRISGISRFILIAVSALLIGAIFLPIWRIELDAPQYPEGLALLINANSIGGDVEIINGLNHYIGMKTLHTNDFIEFKLITPLLIFYSVLSLVVAFIGKRKGLYTLLVAFVIFGIVAMADFWRWEYNYGHDLNPEAAIKVPGMAYQPPLIGFKQLLNFGAYSIPDTGGWLVVISGILIVLAVVLEWRFIKPKPLMSMTVLIGLLFTGCSGKTAEPIKINKDNCSFCEMTITDKKFATEIITKKGKVYKFDDISCLVRFEKENSTAVISNRYGFDYLSPNELVPLESLSFIKSEQISSPMGGNVAAFSSQDSAKTYQVRFNATSTTLMQLLK